MSSRERRPPPPTKEIRVGESAEEILRSLLGVAGEMRMLNRLGNQPERIEEAVEKLRGKLERPRLHGVLAQLAHPFAWPTREHALWMADRLQLAGALLEAMRADAEICGSTAVVERVDAWLESLGLRRT